MARVAVIQRAAGVARPRRPRCARRVGVGRTEARTRRRAAGRLPRGLRARLSGVDLAPAPRARHGPDRAAARAAGARRRSTWPRDDLAPLQRGGARARRDDRLRHRRASTASAAAARCTTASSSIGPDGELLNRHRKLMPTNPERMVWGFGDAIGLKVVDTPVGRVGALICWESYMPLARYALYAQGLRDLRRRRPTTAASAALATMQHIAREGGCWVARLRLRVPGARPARRPARPRRSCSATPTSGSTPATRSSSRRAARSSPVRCTQQRGILYAEIDLERVGAARRSLDVAGHYARPDVFQLQVNMRPQRPVRSPHPATAMD